MPAPFHVREIGSTRPRLRTSLRFSFQEYSGQRCCVIEDPLSSKFHRVGLAEYRFLTLLDGQTTFSEAFARASLASGSEALDEQQAIAVLSWLVENRLADLGGGTPDEVLEETRDKQISAKIRNIANLLFIKIPIGRPDGILNRIHPPLKWLCGWFFFAVWIAVFTAGIAQVALNWDRFVRGTEGILAPHNWLWLALVWIVLKLWHETWHGLICKHHGGEIREAGVLLVLFTPLGYVDASSNWTFPSKWKRMHVAAAGMYGELLVAAIAALVWSATGPGLTNTIALNTMVMASTVTLLFNINPLMRFDGYFILGDMLEIPNLYTKSNQLLKSLAKRWILGVSRVSPPDWHQRETWIFLTYGIASLIWRMIIVFTLLVAAAMLFSGGGLILAVIAFMFWLYPMLASLVRYVRDGHGQELPNRGAAVVRCSAIALALLLLALFPIGLTVRAPGLVQFTGETILRAECPGFVTGIHVRDGMDVDEGTLLVTLTNEDAETELERIALSFERQRVKSSLSRIERRIAEYEAEVSTLDALRAQHAEKLKYVETLDVTAPMNGRVIAPVLPQLRGRFLQTGDEILRVAKAEAGEIAVPVSQNDIDHFRRHIGLPVRVRIPGRGLSTDGSLRRVTARATTRIDHPALSSLGGGPLPVKARDSSLDQDKGHELVNPVFWAIVELTPDGAFGLRSGERAAVKFRSRQSMSLGKLTHTKATHLFNWLFSRATAVG